MGLEITEIYRVVSAIIVPSSQTQYRVDLSIWIMTSSGMPESIGRPIKRDFVFS